MINRSERRREKRITLAEPIVARFGSSIVVVADLSPHGARIEHYSRLDRGTERPLRVVWGKDDLGVRARVMTCRVERLISGDAGLTIYRSGLSFDESQVEEVERIRQIISNVVAKTLLEQVANARGFWTDDKPDMPIFRDGILTTNDPNLSQKLDKFMPNSSVARKRGFVRLSLDRGRWKNTWTLDPRQPDEGFTVSAAETPDQIDMLCDAYIKSDAAGKQLIRKLAAASVEKSSSG